MSLTRLKVLVTRPEGQAAGLLAALEQAGAQACHYPVMAISALTEPEHIQQCKQRIMALDEYQQVIFISSNAVHYGVDWIEQYWPQLPVGIQWHGIGKSTRKHLMAAGLPILDGNSDGDGHAESAAMNSEALLQHENLQQLNGQKLLIIRGVGGREYLQQQLQQRGGQVNYAQCYQRGLVDKPLGEINQLIEQQGINTVCVNSGESLQNLCVLLGEAGLAAVKKHLLIVPSERVATIARQLGFGNIVTAANASDEAMVAAMPCSLSRL